MSTSIKSTNPHEVVRVYNVEGSLGPNILRRKRVTTYLLEHAHYQYIQKAVDFAAGIVKLGACEVLPASDLPIYQVPSSLEMLRGGSLKQSAWSVLKPLRAGD